MHVGSSLSDSRTNIIAYLLVKAGIVVTGDEVRSDTAEWLFYRNVHVIQTGCFQAQTPFTRGKGISVHLGGYIVTVSVDEDGTIRGFSPEFIPYYKSIKDDYKYYWRR